jgi:hypothetical protein
MIYLRRTTDQWPIYSRFTGRLLKFDSPAEAAAAITRMGLSGRAFYIDTDREEGTDAQQNNRQEAVARRVPRHRQAVLSKPKRG